MDNLTAFKSRLSAALSQKTEAGYADAQVVKLERDGRLKLNGDGSIYASNTNGQALTGTPDEILRRLVDDVVGETPYRYIRKDEPAEPKRQTGREESAETDPLEWAKTRTQRQVEAFRGTTYSI